MIKFLRGFIVMWSLRKFYIPILLLRNEHLKKKNTVLTSFSKKLKKRARFCPWTNINGNILKKIHKKREHLVNNDFLRFCYLFLFLLKMLLQLFHSYTTNKFLNRKLLKITEFSGTHSRTSLKCHITIPSRLFLLY